MNLRCMYCQTMFGVSREVMLIGLQTMEAEKLTHYDVYCPKCRRANRVERRKLELANPNWQESLKQMAKEAAKAEKEGAAPAKEEKPAPEKKAAPKKPAAKSKAKTSGAKKPAATSSPKGKAKAK
jgi:phage FluMu protein Com